MTRILSDTHDSCCVAAIYNFVSFDDPQAVQAQLQERCEALGISGTMIIAHEGLNGTVAGGHNAIAQLVGFIRSLPGCADIEVKYSYADSPPFPRMKVKFKREIVTLGLEGVDPVNNAGIYVEPQDWNALISDPDTVVIDTRNYYECEIGTFSGAINPETRNFREFPEWFARTRERWEEEGRAPPKIAMFCTGGIRCEKSTAMARSMGCEEVYHLKGGILKYLEEVPKQESLWEGNCFVFDKRVSVTHGLALTDDVMCETCNCAYSGSSEHICPGEQR